MSSQIKEGGHLHGVDALSSLKWQRRGDCPAVGSAIIIVKRRDRLQQRLSNSVTKHTVGTWRGCVHKAQGRSGPICVDGCALHEIESEPERSCAVDESLPPQKAPTCSEIEPQVVHTLRHLFPKTLHGKCIQSAVMHEVLSAVPKVATPIYSGRKSVSPVVTKKKIHPHEQYEAKYLLA